jgi:hypothetical protein
MSKGYVYDLWDGNQVVGVYRSDDPLTGRVLRVPWECGFFDVPFMYLAQLDADGKATTRKVLDVSNISKQEIDRLLHAAS